MAHFYTGQACKCVLRSEADAELRSGQEGRPSCGVSAYLRRCKKLYQSWNVKTKSVVLSQK